MSEKDVGKESDYNLWAEILPAENQSSRSLASSSGTNSAVNSGSSSNSSLSSSGHSVLKGSAPIQLIESPPSPSVGKLRSKKGNSVDLDKKMTRSSVVLMPIKSRSSMPLENDTVGSPGNGGKDEIIKERSGSITVKDINIKKYFFFWFF